MNLGYDPQEHVPTKFKDLDEAAEAYDKLKSMVEKLRINFQAYLNDE